MLITKFLKEIIILTFNQCAHILCNKRNDMKNITLSIDEDILQAGREYARIHDMSFNVLVRKLIEQTVVPQKDKWLSDTFSLMDKVNVSSNGNKWSREELYRV